MTLHNDTSPLVEQLGLYYYLGGPRFWAAGPAFPLLGLDNGLLAWEQPDPACFTTPLPTIAFDPAGLNLLFSGRHLFVVWLPPMRVLPIPTATTPFPFSLPHLRDRKRS